MSPTNVVNFDDPLWLEDPAWYEADPHPMLARLRAEEPVYWYEPLNLWVLSKYNDIREVGRDQVTYSVKNGTLLNDYRYGGILASFMPPDCEMISLVDPQRHEEIRAELKSFSGIAIKRIEGSVRQACIELVDRIEPGKEVDFAKEVSIPLPLKLIASLIGVPVDDAEMLLVWSDEIVKMGGNLTGEELAEIAGSLTPMREYFDAHIALRQANPRDDFLSELIDAEANGRLSRESVHAMLTTVLSAGNETARNTVTGGMITLADHQDQYRDLVQDLSLAKSATEEFLRWVTPARAMGRTVMTNTEIRGVKMEPGQFVYMLYMSGNRDEEIFQNPDRFDIATRRERGQLAFGFGPHICPGASLARLEIRVVLEEVAKRFSGFELTGEPEKIPSVFVHGWSSLPLTFTK